MVNQPFSNRRANGWGCWRMSLFAGLWILAIFHSPAMGDEMHRPLTPSTPVAEESRFNAESSSPSATSQHPLPRVAYGAKQTADTVAIPWTRPGVAVLIVLIAGGVIILAARTMWRNKKGFVAFSHNDCQVRLIAESIGDVYWLGAADFSHLEYVSSAYETIWGQSCESLYKAPMAWTESLFPHDRQAVMDVIARHQSTGSSTGVFPDFRIVRPDGAIRWIHARTFDIKTVKGAGHRMIGIFQDITRNKFFEVSLRESDEKWRSLMENSPDHIMLMDLDGHILFANRVFMGLENSQLVGKSLNRLIDPRFEPVVKACMQTVVGNGQSDTCRVECNCCGDRPLIFELRMGPVTVSDRIVAVAVNSTEITKRVEQEKALQESEAFHRTLFDDAPTGMAIQDFSAVETFSRQLAERGETDLGPYLMAHPEDVSRLADQVRVVKVNQAMVNLYQASSAKMLLGPLSRFYKNHDRQHFIDQIVTFVSGEDRYEGEARNVDLSGHTVHVIIRKVVVQRKDNGLSKVLTSLIDVTPLKTAEKDREVLMLQLQQAQKMEAIGTLAGGVAHDFNNILSIILGNVELAVADMSEDHPVFHNLSEIQSAVSRAREIVKQLLGISRNSEQNLTFMHLVPVVEEAVNFLRATIPSNIRIQTSLSVDRDVICADSTHIHQIMINLFTNASHAMEGKGGQLSVEAENVTLMEILPGVAHPIPPGAYLRLTVSDTGMGIADEIKGRIFDPYFTTKVVGKGTGMGLCMVLGIMKNSGGGIVLDSQPGEGTRFVLYFPLADMPASMQDRKEATILSGSERILFVDDEMLIVDLSVKMLNRLGYRVTSCTDAIHALALLETDPSAFDLVITDVTMPGLTGYQLIERIRQAASRLPVILCTGHVERVSAEQIETLAISDVLVKPVGLNVLATAIRRVLDSSGPPA